MTKQILPKVFAWMCFGLLVTFLTGYVLSLNPTAVINMASSFGGWGLLILAIIEIGLVIFTYCQIIISTLCICQWLNIFKYLLSLWNNLSLICVPNHINSICFICYYWCHNKNGSNQNRNISIYGLNRSCDLYDY